jgi:hypothetical protein
LVIVKNTHTNPEKPPSSSSSRLKRMYRFHHCRGVALLQTKRTRGNNSCRGRSNHKQQGTPHIKQIVQVKRDIRDEEPSLGEKRAALLLGKVATLDELVSLRDCARDIRNQVPQHRNNNQEKKRNLREIGLASGVQDRAAGGEEGEHSPR